MFLYCVHYQVTSFLAQLKWTLLRVLVKDFSPKLAIGLKRHLLPLLRIPGLSALEAAALHTDNITNPDAGTYKL
jgi:hypothetical protein